MLNLNVEDVQNYLRINDNEDQYLLQDLIDGAIEDVNNFVNTEYKATPSKFTTVALRIVAIRYENRTTLVHNRIGPSIGDLIQEELKGLSSYRKEPGL